MLNGEKQCSTCSLFTAVIKANQVLFNCLIYVRKDACRTM